MKITQTTTLLIEGDDMALSAKLLAALDRINKSVADLPQRIANAQAASGTATVTEQDTAADGLNTLADTVDGIDPAAAPPATGGSVPATPSGETPVGGTPQTF